MRAARGLWVIAIGILAGCIPEARLQPLPEARSLAGEPSAAVAESFGVRLIADGASWKGRPGNLERRLTPVEVRLENHSGRPLKIQYEFFDIEGASRFHYAAIPPTSLDEATADSTPVCTASRPAWGMSLAWGTHRPWGWRRWGGYGPWGPGWSSPFYDPFYDPFYRPYVQCEEPLPTQDMLDRALPEGTLENGGIISGFLYFQGVAERERQVTLVARLVDARTGEPVGTLSIPFQVHTG
ncbi:hypothetical protein [Hyalangium rubrum]|uniref:Lipoprotein n=1 Tax=Hyalangium rubrum TaxID=3103134 RepID=A0ABU5H650_9BACT|nr:hypothetical protein [Hyalangium sp. s54d21]MDY7228933.1 hypothetical protein [Hyalangium sp. s54d21]